MNGPVLITGANGFIGGCLVRRLLGEGADLRLLVRDPGAVAHDISASAQVMAGDVRDAALMDRAVRGCRTVLHLAAVARAWGDAAEFQSTNVDAVRLLLEAAERFGVERVVHVSTVLAAPPHAPAAVPAFARILTPYETTKIEAERVVAGFVGRGLHVVIVRPTRVFGPGPLSNDANALTRIVARYLAGRFRARLNDAGVLANYVHVDDVALGIILAARRAPAGARYFLGGQNASFEQFLRTVGDVGGVRRRTVAVPAGLALALGRAAEAWGTLGGRAPITAGWVRVFLQDHRVDIAPARSQLGYAPRMLRAALEDTIAWLRLGGLSAAA